MCLTYTNNRIVVFVSNSEWEGAHVHVIFSAFSILIHIVNVFSLLSVYVIHSGIKRKQFSHLQVTPTAFFINYAAVCNLFSFKSIIWSSTFYKCLLLLQDYELVNEKFCWFRHTTTTTHHRHSHVWSLKFIRKWLWLLPRNRIEELF